MIRAVILEFCDITARRSRLSFTLHCLAALALLFGIWIAAIAAQHRIATQSAYAATTLLGLSSLVAQAQRCRDINIAAWWALAGLIPGFGQVFTFALCLIPGRVGGA